MKWLAVISYLAMISINALATTVGINGKTTGEISNEVDVLFTPAGYVFAIWGLIYILLGIWLFQQLRLPTDEVSRYRIDLFLITCLYNIAWLLSWHYNYFLISVVVMICLLLSLIIIYRSYPAGDYRLSDRLPFSVYLGWISVALMANISYVLKYYGWNGWGISEQTWAQILLLLATLLAFYIRVKNRDILFSFVVIWAFIGIAVQNGKDAGALFYMPFVYSLLLLFWIFVGMKWDIPRKMKSLKPSSKN
ncbi:tryptophan-rich sensory protein [Lysinibacillus sp. 54212]|uniref:tryptophan-rich sensory protein n=1 Tax=Lysinibacillus sp. 54212 TaxID=3119829 RepID=UPI002FC94DF2